MQSHGTVPRRWKQFHFLPMQICNKWKLYELSVGDHAAGRYIDALLTLPFTRFHIASTFTRFSSPAILIQLFNECVAHYSTDHESSRWMVQVFRSGKNGLARFRFADRTKYAIFYCRFSLSSSFGTVGLLRISRLVCMLIPHGMANAHMIMSSSNSGSLLPHHQQHNGKYLNNFNILFI